MVGNLKVRAEITSIIEPCAGKYYEFDVKNTGKIYDLVEQLLVLKKLNILPTLHIH